MKRNSPQTCSVARVRTLSTTSWHHPQWPCPSLPCLAEPHFRWSTLCSAPTLKLLSAGWEKLSIHFKLYLNWAPQRCSATPWHFSSLFHSLRHHFTPPLFHKHLPAPPSSESLLTHPLTSILPPFSQPCIHHIRLNDPLNKSDNTFSAQDPPKTFYLNRRKVKIFTTAEQDLRPDYLSLFGPTM